LPLLQVTLSSNATDAPDLSPVWTIILFVYGLTAVVLVVALPLCYLMVRVGRRIDYWVLGIRSELAPIAAAELPATIIALRQTMVRRGLTVACVSAVFVISSALVIVIGFGSGTQYQSLPYVGIAVLAALGETVLFIVPIFITVYFAERSNVWHRVRRLNSPS
jgi:hypothetical protein